MTRQVSEYPTPYDGRARESYLGEVSVNTETLAQAAHADTTYDLSWSGVDVRVRSTMSVAIGVAGYDVHIATVATREDEIVSERTWTETIPR